MLKSKKIVIIGAGNLATRLSIALGTSGNKILSIYSKTADNAEKLAKILNTHWTNELQSIPNDGDIYILAIPDQVIIDVLTKCNFGSALVVHCSGGIGIEIFKNKIKNYGVFYPLQTFTKSREVNFKKIPICIESDNTYNRKILIDLGNQISDDVRLIDSAHRKVMHLAAVFACNFVNYMYTCAYEILENKQINPEILKPLMVETLNKAISLNPVKAQTGPALRNDKNVIKKHLELLSFSTEIHELYKILSEDILDFYSKRLS